MSTSNYDIVSVSDFRLPGGSNASIAEEIKAQAAAGYSTGLVHIPVYDRDHPINPRIQACLDAGLATLVGEDTRVSTRLLTIRPPKVAEELHPQLTTVSAELTLVVVNQPASDGNRHIRSVWTVPTTPYPGAHYAVFPPKLIEPCIKAVSPQGGVVLDPFAGSGTTGMVAQTLSRKAILIDLNPEYLVQCLTRNAGVPLGL